jgi:hypothetical protein
LQSNIFRITFILIIHHFISIFLHFGWIFNNKTILILYILSVNIIYVQFLFNDDKCVLTQIENKLCQYKPYRHFTDYFHWIGIKGEKIYGIDIPDMYISIVYTYAWYKLINS